MSGPGLPEWRREVVAEDELSTWCVERRTIRDPDEAQLLAALREHAGHDPIRPWLEGIADHCDRVLAENGWPAAVQWVQHDGAGKWWPPEEGGPRPGETRRFDWGGLLAQRHAADFSDAWYAGRIGFSCRRLLALVARGEFGASSMAMAARIASERTDWHWRRGHKANVLTGRKQRRALAGLRETTNAAKAELVRRRWGIIAAMLAETRLTGGGLEAWLARRLREEHGIEASRRTIRRDIKALRPNL